MSEEIALAAADLATVAQLRARVLEWEDTYDRLAGAFSLHMDVLECKQALSDYAGVFYDVVLGAAHAEVARLTEALHQVERMKTIIGARRIVADALGEKER